MPGGDILAFVHTIRKIEIIKSRPMADMAQQIKVLEALLSMQDNKECADCTSKTPRWASITFGIFVCLRCSGKPRAIRTAHFFPLGSY